MNRRRFLQATASLPLVAPTAGAMIARAQAETMPFDRAASVSLPHVRDSLLPALPSLCAGRCAEAEIRVDFINDRLILHIYDRDRGINRRGAIVTRREIDDGSYKDKFAERVKAFIGGK